jgi:hypothetical protein
MENLSAAHRQINASTIGRYRAMATPYRDGTWNHDVSQKFQALLAAIAGTPPYRILDHGCGPARDLVTFRDPGHMVVGLDGCPEFVAINLHGIFQLDMAARLPSDPPTLEGASGQLPLQAIQILLILDPYHLRAGDLDLAAKSVVRAVDALAGGVSGPIKPIIGH